MRSCLSTIHKEWTTLILYFFATWFSAAIIREWFLFLWTACWDQRWLDKVRTSDTVMNARPQSVVRTASQSCCQLWKQVVNMNRPNTSPVIVVRNYLYMCACVAYTSWSYYSLLVEGDFYFARTKYLITYVNFRLTTKLELLVQSAQITKHMCDC